MPLLPLLAYAHQQVAAVLAPGDRALDGTVGNGHDTRFLAEQVGPTGQVYGFDIQAAALQSARARLDASGVARWVTLHQDSHAHLAHHLAGLEGSLRAAMFNLGYLPGSDKTVVTQPESTLVALRATLPLLGPGGRLSIVLYPAHPGGQAESEAVLAWARSLPPPRAQVLWYQFLNPRTPPPSLLLIEKR